MEISDFFSLLRRHKLTLILVPLITMVVCYFLVRNIPDSYTSQTQIATGIADQSQKLPDFQISQESQVFTAFSNLIATIKTKKILNQVSYQLMMHDLTSDAPFRQPSKVLHDLNASARAHALAVYSKMYATHGSLMLWDKDQAGLNMLLGSMHYDPTSLETKLVVERAENSDFIRVEFESENPQLSAFVVNTLTKEFIDYHTFTESDNQGKSIRSLDSLLKKKKALMDKKADDLRDYKIKNHILDVTDQSNTLYNQLSELESKKQQAIKDMAANKGAIQGIDDKFNPSDRKYVGSTSKLNTRIAMHRELMGKYSDAWQKSGFNNYYKLKADSVKAILAEETAQSSELSGDSPISQKNGLRSTKLGLETTLDQAKYSIKPIDAEISRVRAELDNLVPHSAYIADMQSSIDIDNKEYLDLLAQYNKANVNATFTTKLRQIDLAVPGAAIPSKKIVILVASAIVSEIVCLLVLFVIFFMDSSIKHTRTLVNQTGLPALGHLNLIQGQTLDLRKMWDTENNSKMQEFKDLLRSIRFEIDQELHDNKVLAITSLQEGEGKTLLAISLAYSYSIVNKKVLLIDGNFTNNTISKTVNPQYYIEDFFRGDRNVVLNSNIGVLGNQGTDLTLLEIDNERIIQQKFRELKTIYDIIIIEVQDMEKMNKAKEWLLFADKTIAVFENGQTLNGNKQNSVSYLKALGPKFAGWVFNKAGGTQNVAS